MATIPATSAQTLADSVAKHIIDSVALIGSSAAITTGQATTLAEVAALNDQVEEFALLPAFKAAVANESAWLVSEAQYNTILDNWFPVMVALDAHVAGLPAFLRSNSKFVDPHFLDAFNRAAARGAVYPAAPLTPDLAFGQAISNMAQITVTGAATGTFLAGTSQLAAYGNAPLSIFNAAGVNTGATPTVVTVTYNSYNGAGTLVTGLTATATMPNGSVPNAAVSLAVNGTQITAIAITGGNVADVIGVKATLLRTVTY